ncbi:MAG: hypothetical protein M3083_01660 [Actinomycetota bacterium]|nr:hypothetical protein [Actinomycetota bacterium]MDQ6944978.1 hypothetical protein [Actinomycetota bacterium]
MTDREGTWLVLVRDVSHAVRVRGHSQLSAGLVLDMETGLMRGLAVAPTDGEALAQALATAVHKPAGPLSPGLPARVLSGPGLGEPLAEALSQVSDEMARPDITEVDPPAEAEDIFDSFMGHMAGRAQPRDLPAPRDWELLYDQALTFYRAQPWSRWHDGIDLAVEIAVDGSTTLYAGVVMGYAGLTYGVVLYPGERAPAELESWNPGQPAPLPPGTLLCTLDPPEEPPPELLTKARRYGWPPDAELVPVFLRLGRDQDGGDPDPLDVQRLTVGLAAITSHDARGPVLAGQATEATTGAVALSDGKHGRFSVHQRRPADEALSDRFGVHQAGFDLVPEGTPVVVGHLPWAALVSLRRAARIHRPFPAQAPKPTGGEIPLLAVLPKRSQGDRIAAKTADLDPYGVAVIETDDGQAVFTLVGGNGAQILMEVAADHPSLTLFRRRLRQTKGLHVVMIADETTTHGKGTVYGLFECHQPPPTKQRQPRASKPSPKRRR